MLVNYTAEEEKKLAAIRDKYTPERKELAKAYKNLLEDNSGEAKAERLKINRQQQAITETMVEEMQDYIYKLEDERFEEIKKGGASTVIKHAAAQAPEILEYMRRNTVVEARYYEGLEANFLHSIGISKIRNDTVYFRSSYATAYLKQQLRLHISFLKDDPESLQQIQKAIQEAVQNAPFIDLEDKEEETATLPPQILQRGYIGKLDIMYPLDKPNSELWRLVSDDESGQLSFFAETGKEKKDKNIGILVALSWDDTGVKITKDIKEFDKRVYTILGSFFENGIYRITLNEIHKKMGNDNTGSAKQLKKINDSITKMGAAHLFLDNKSEVDAGYEMPLLHYDASLLPYERYTLTYRGKKTTVIQLLRYPPISEFAKLRKQITTFSEELFKSPISKTEDNLLLEDYLIERISKMKNNSQLSRKILYTTLCKKCNINTKNKKQRLPIKIKTYLDHYKKCDNWIKGYIIDENKDIIIQL